jgi:hypothetical protein
MILRLFEDSDLLVECVREEDVHRLHDVRFNVNNLWSRDRPADYAQVLASHKTSLWAAPLCKKFAQFRIPTSELAWMLRAWRVGRYQGEQFPLSFAEDLEAFLSKHETDWPEGAWFVRSERVSLKTGMHGVGPYTCLRAVAESLVTCVMGHAPFDHLEDSEDGTFCLYLFPWMPDLQPDLEFRAFVFHGRVTCISQQHLHQRNQVLEALSEAERVSMVREWVRAIVACQQDVASKVPQLAGPSACYTFDVAYVLDTGQALFIEPNSFGAEYAAGSALFHWLEDEALLCRANDGPTCFRFTG